MVDPLAEVVTLLRPGARFSKLVVGAGPWHIRRSDAGQPFYCVVLEGACRLVLDGHEAIELQSGDFILIPAAYGVAMSSLVPPAEEAPETLPVALATGEFRIGDQDSPTDLRMLVGHCSFGSPDAGMLVSLLPQLVHVRGEPRLTTLVQLLRDEFRERRSAREVILAHLLEVLLIEGLRSTAGTAASPGLVRGLADESALPRRYDGCTKAQRGCGRSHSWRRRLGCLVQPSSSGSAERWASRRWSICWLGAWLWPRTCFGRTKAASPKLRNVSAMVPRARSASHSPAMSDCRRPGMRASRQNRRRLRPRHATAVMPAARSRDHISSRLGAAPILSVMCVLDRY
jgi:hypothetical protein